MFDNRGVLLTGATGFLGSRLMMTLKSKPEFNITAAVRRSVKIPDVSVVEIPDFNADADWTVALSGQQVVIHTAARAHIMKDEVADPLAGVFINKERGLAA